MNHNNSIAALLVTVMNITNNIITLKIEALINLGKKQEVWDDRRECIILLTEATINLGKKQEVHDDYKKCII